MIDEPRVRADNLLHDIVIRSDSHPEQEPVVLLGRRADELDIGLAFHAFERAKDLAFNLDGFRRTPFRSSEKEKRVETLVTTLVEFAVSARRYLELVSDRDLKDFQVSKANGLSFYFALNRLVHSVTFIPLYRNAKTESGKRPDRETRDTLAIGVQVRTKERELVDIGLREICNAFLDHQPIALFDALDKHEQSTKAARQQAILNSEKK